jgi:hypothetical protein
MALLAHRVTDTLLVVIGSSCYNDPWCQASLAMRVDCLLSHRVFRCDVDVHFFVHGPLSVHGRLRSHFAWPLQP